VRTITRYSYPTPQQFSSGNRREQMNHETALKRVNGHTQELYVIREYTKEILGDTARVSFEFNGEKIESAFLPEAELDDLIIGWEDGRASFADLSFLAPDAKRTDLVLTLESAKKTMSREQIFGLFGWTALMSLSAQS
jgi:hypothetical protein